jgi:hypothetical protein
MPAPDRHLRPVGTRLTPALAVGLALFVGACGSSETEPDTQAALIEETSSTDAAGADATTGADAGEPGAAGEPTGPRLSAEVFDGEATTVDGASFDLATLASKDLVVWFWAPW